MAATVQIRGLAELQRALRSMGAELPRELRRGLKDGAEIVAAEARNRSSVRSGMQRRSIRSFARGRSAGVRVTAKRRSAAYPSGYPYPRKNEYQRRAFVRPALQAKAPAVADRVGEGLDRLAARHFNA